ncbi:DUF262 domain-containing protein [Maridesulfovibrio sp.]|uniref:DUF262 domain-containing protein n=1 Tax=Maridesulfovibrio sp. TaxID=2795000 RepID=UPI003BA97576
MNKATFGTELVSLPDLFDGNLFIIPDYQRGYSWDEKQVFELLQDIDHLVGDNVNIRHYTGTIVLSQAAGLETGEFHIVDGQQRLTSLIIIMRVLMDYIPSETQFVRERYLKRGELGNERAVLLVNSDSRLYFDRVILGDGDDVEEQAVLEVHKRLFSARAVVKKWLKKRLSSGVQAQDILSVIESELGFLVYAPKEDAETGIMFEVINNRGKALSELEKVKNFLIYCCVKLQARTTRNMINEDWTDILKYLTFAKKTTTADEGAFLRYCVAVHFKLNKTDSQYGYASLKKIIDIDHALSNKVKKKEAINKIIDFMRFMKKSSIWYARLYGRLHDGLDSELSGVLDQIRAQDRHASIMPLFLSLVVKSGLHADQRLHLLGLLEILNFRVYMARNITNRNDSGQGDLYYYASRFYHDELLDDFCKEKRVVGKRRIQSQEDALEYCLVYFTLDYAIDERFLGSFVLEQGSPYDFYKWSGLRFFLMSYEASLQPNKSIQIDKILLKRAEGKSADYLSVEHIWADKHRNNEGENNRIVDRFEKRRLGNFVLLELRLNIQGDNLWLDEKLPIYLKGVNSEPPSDLTHVRSMGNKAKKILKAYSGMKRAKNYYLSIHRDLNDSQERKLIRFAKKRWSLEKFLGYSTLLKKMLAADDD